MSNEQSIAVDERYQINDPASHTVGANNDPTWQKGPEFGLWTAVLLESIGDCRKLCGIRVSQRGRPKGIDSLARKYDNKKRNKQLLASWDWVHDDDTAPYTFTWVCEMLGQDAGYIRKQLAAELAGLTKVA